MIFDADQYVEALSLPSIKIRGKVITGRILSIEQWTPLLPMVRKAIADEASYDEMKKLCLAYCRLAFPDPWWRMFWGKTNARKILGLPPNVMMKALVDFFVCQGEATVLVSVPLEKGSLELQPATS